VKKKPDRNERREIRLRKARQWILTYDGSQRHIVRNYRKRFKVDPSCAHADLEAIGALAPERLAHMRETEAIRLQKLREKREAKKERDVHEMFPNSDDRFFFIAGYTSGGVPYGTTWEEMDLEPWEMHEFSL
jgi:hypothetical protein